MSQAHPGFSQGHTATGKQNYYSVQAVIAPSLNWDQDGP